MTFRKFIVEHGHYAWIVIAALVVPAGVMWLLNFERTDINNQTEQIEQESAPEHSVTVCAPADNRIYFSNEESEVSFTDLIVREIENARRSLDIAVYSLKSEPIKKAIYGAYDRGVKVVLILDYRKKDVHDEFLSDLPAGIKRLDLGSDWPGSMLMHHKFALIDRHEEDPHLVFGSFNWTELQEAYDRSFLMLSRDRELVDGFGREFSRLETGASGRNKLDLSGYSPWDLSADCPDRYFELWFSPGRKEENVRDRIIQMIRQAESKIHVMAWSFTDEQIARELLARAEAGQEVTVIMDGLNFNQEYSVAGLLLREKEKNGLETLNIYTDTKALELPQEYIGPEPANPFLHHHVLIIDNREALLGTNNWSSGGSFYNDESILVTDEPEIISGLVSSFEYNLQTHGLAHK